MNETEWLAANIPSYMLDHLRGKAGGRKLRLFACACCGRVRDLLRRIDTRLWQVVEVAEREIEGQALSKEVRRALANCSCCRGLEHYEQSAQGSACRAVRALEESDPWNAATEASRGAAGLVGFANEERSDAVVVEWRAQAALLRDLFGNPFRPTRLLLSALTDPEGAVGKLARTIYRERTFADLPVLADALEEAGCADEEVLEHCRAPTEHARGCWVVDTVLGKS
jgi:hypothetical protein